MNRIQTKNYIVKTSTAFSGLMLPFVTFALVSENSGGSTLSSIVSAVVSIINQLVGLVVGAALVVFLWGLARFILKAGDTTEHAKGRTLMIWGLIIFFVMGSLWGILRLLGSSIFSIT